MIFSKNFIKECEKEEGKHWLKTIFFGITTVISIEQMVSSVFKCGRFSAAKDMAKEINLEEEEMNLKAKQWNDMMKE